MRKLVLVAGLALAPHSPALAQAPDRFTHADTLRGANGPARAWWDATFYDLHVRVNPAQEMQIDLQEPMQVDSIVQDRRKLTTRRDGNALFVTLAARQRAGETR